MVQALILLMNRFDWFAKKTEEMPKDANKEQVKVLSIVNEIVKFNEQIQQGQELKIRTPDQMLSRLPIFLAQLKAENNSEKRKNEIRQLLYSLYRSNGLTKNIYKSLIDII